MRIKSTYQHRSIRFLKVHQHHQWKIKIYSISHKNEFANNSLVMSAMENLENWLKLSETTTFDTYHIAILMLHDERNAWVKHILMKNANPDWNSYLNDHLNQNT